MNPKLKKTLSVVIPILLSIGLVWYSLNKVPLEKILFEAKQADLKWLLVSVVCLNLSHMSRAYRWLFMLKPLGYNVRYLNSLMAVFSAYLMNYGIPRSGEVARATIMTKYEDVPFEKSFGTIISERVIDTVVMLIIMIITLVLQYDFIVDFFSSLFKTSHIFTIISIVTVVFLTIIIFRYSKIKFATKIKDFFKGLVEGLISVLKMEKKWQFVFHTFFIWSMYLFMFYSGIQSFEALKSLPLSAVLIGFIAGSFSVAATNGGTGSYPEAIFIAFKSFNVLADLSRAFGWVIWGIQTIVTVILGGLSLILLPVYNKNKTIKSI